MGHNNSPNSTSNISLYLSVTNRTIKIYDSNKDVHTLDYELPPIPANIEEPLWSRAADWKRVHTLTGTLYQDFVDFHKCTIYLRAAEGYLKDLKKDQDKFVMDFKVAHYKQQAEENFKRFLEPKFDNFVYEIDKLPPIVSDIEFIKQLKKIRLCYPPIMQSLASKEPEFSYGLNLADFIQNWLINALRRADMILEKHFDEIKKK